MLIQVATPALRSLLIYRVPCSAAMFLQVSKAKERCVKSLLYFPCFHGLCAVGFLHICMCCVCVQPVQMWPKRLMFFLKIIKLAVLDGTHL